MLPKMREELEKYIYERYVNDSFTLRNHLITIAKELKDKIIIDRVSSIFKGDTLISTIRDEELFWISKTLIKVAEDKHIRLEKYFSDREEKEFELFELPEANRINKRLLLFENVSQIEEGREWLVPVLSQEKIEEINDNSLLNYNVNTQRPAIIEETAYGARTRINLNYVSIDKMETGIIDGTFSNNELKVNALETGNENIVFEPYPFSSDGTLGRLIIEIDHESGKEVNLIDGMHRYTATLQAIRKVKAQNKRIKTKFSLRIHHTDERGARDIISQQNKQNPFEEVALSYYDTNDDYTIIVDRLNDSNASSKCILAEKITRTLEEALILGKMTSYEILTSAIKRDFDIPNKDKIKRGFVIDTLTEGLNIIISTLGETIEDYQIKEDRKTSFRFEPEMFNGYIHLCKLTENMPRITRVIYNTINKINFDKENGDFKNINFSRTKSNRDVNIINSKINEVFEEKLQEVKEEMGV